MDYYHAPKTHTLLQALTTYAQPKLAKECAKFPMGTKTNKLTIEDLEYGRTAYNRVDGP